MNNVIAFCILGSVFIMAFFWAIVKLAVVNSQKESIASQERMKTAEYAATLKMLEFKEAAELRKMVAKKNTAKKKEKV